MASDGNVYVMGEKGVAKHEKKLVDLRLHHDVPAWINWRI
jgi:hypothetical protein